MGNGWGQYSYLTGLPSRVDIGGDMRSIAVAPVVLVGIILAFPHDSWALTGAELYKFCSGRSADGTIACTAYVQGFIDGFIFGKGSEKMGVNWCPPGGPKGVSGTQSRLIVEKFLRDQPQKLNDEAGLLVGEALLDAFPCSRK